MEEDDNTDRQMRLELLCQKLKNIKSTYLSEDADISPKHADNINQALNSSSPETCLAYLMNMEKKGNPQTDSVFLAKLVECYLRVFSSLPMYKYSQNESCARILVRYAQLKALQDPGEAQESFTSACSNSESFAFVHIAHAQFELSQGNAKKSALILERAFGANAKPTEFLELAMQNLECGRSQLLPQEDKENITVPAVSVLQGPMRRLPEPCSASRTSDGSAELQLGSAFCAGANHKSSVREDSLPLWRSGSHSKKPSAVPDRLPLVPLPVHEGNDGGKALKKSGDSCPNSVTWQTSATRANPAFGFSAKKCSGDGDSYNLQNLKLSVSPEMSLRVDPGPPVESTTTILNRPDKKSSSTFEDCTDHINQALNASSPETCLAYLTNMEKRGNPQTDSVLLAKLMQCYSHVFSSLPLSKYSQNESYARILVRFAELKAMRDPDEARDNFIVARSNSKSFAFVHISHAQFELSQGNATKSASILKKAFDANAKPTELLELAMQNLECGRSQLLPQEDKENITGPSASLSETQEKVDGDQGGMSNLGPYRPLCKDLSSEWKLPGRIPRHPSGEDKLPSGSSMQAPWGAEQTPAPHVLLSVRGSTALACQTPTFKVPANHSYATPVQKNPALGALTPVPENGCSAQPPCTPVDQVCRPRPTPQSALPSLASNSITIKGRQFFILKMIGRGGSSKVYQVLDHQKQLFAVKHVNLEEADAQTVESYKNEIEHLNHLQQYSDQIIKLYDYEITNNYICMLMECGNLDLNTWLRNHKVDPLERKFYWKNMLEAVQTIHKHGIVHSDLKPANFVIVNASLKLIDFGIANRIQPDVTSIMKDSQVGTLNYMPPEAIKDTSAKAGKPSSKISPKGDVWSLGCILYCMTYGKTPFQHITNQITKLHAIIDPSHQIDFPDISERHLLDVLKRCLVRNPKERISISELLAHPYLQLQPSPPPVQPENHDLQQILNYLALRSPNSIARAANNLAQMCNSGKKLDVSECLKPWNM